MPDTPTLLFQLDWLKRKRGNALRCCFVNLEDEDKSQILHLFGFVQDYARISDDSMLALFARLKPSLACCDQCRFSSMKSAVLSSITWVEIFSMTQCGFASIAWSVCLFEFSALCPTVLSSLVTILLLLPCLTYLIKVSHIWGGVKGEMEKGLSGVFIF